MNFSAANAKAWINVAFWYGSSSIAVVTLKWSIDDVLKSGHEHSTMLYLVSYCSFAQLMATLVISSLIEHRLESFSPLGKFAAFSCTVTNISPGLWHCLGTASANWATFALGASTTQLIKLLEPGTTIVLLWLLFRIRPSRGVIISVLLTSIGVLILSKPSFGDVIWIRDNYLCTETLSVLMKLACTFASITTFPLSNVLIKQGDGDKEKPLRTTIETSLVGVSFLFPFLFIFTFLYPGCASCLQQTLKTNFWIMCTCNAGYRIFSFTALKQFDAVYHSQLRLGKRFFTVMLSVFILHDFHTSRMKLLIGGSILFVGLSLPLIASAENRSMKETVNSHDPQSIMSFSGTSEQDVSDSVEVKSNNDKNRKYVLTCPKMKITEILVFYVFMAIMHVSYRPEIDIEIKTSFGNIPHRLLIGASLMPQYMDVKPSKILLINYTGKKGWHFGQQGASYIQERLLMDMFGPETTITRWWQSDSQQFDSVLTTVNLVVANAEGTLHDKFNGWKKMLDKIIDRNVTLWIANGSFSYVTAPKLLPQILKQASFMSIRDPLSFFNFLYLSNGSSRSTGGGLSKLAPVMSSDFTFLLPNDFDENIESKMRRKFPTWSNTSRDFNTSPRIILSGSSKSESAYLKLWKSLILLVKSASPEAKIMIVLCGTRIPEIRTLGGDMLLNHPRATLAEMLWLMKNADVHIGGRFHAATYAMTASLPSVLFEGNTWKISSTVQGMRSDTAIMFDKDITQADGAVVWQAAKQVVYNARKLNIVEKEARIERLASLATRNFPVSFSKINRKIDEVELMYQENYLESLKIPEGQEIQLCEVFGCLE